MQYYIEEPGLLFDCLTFLSLWTEDPTAENNPFVRDIKNGLQQKGIERPDHLSPLTGRLGRPHSFLYAAFFYEWEYSRCVFINIEQALKNRLALKQKFAEFISPDADPDSVRKMARSSYPETVKLMKALQIEPSLHADYLYILLSFDDAMKEASGLINIVRAEMEKLHRQFIGQNADALRLIQKAPTANKLKAISGLSFNTPIRFSLSLMDEERISFLPDEQDFFILGSRFSEVLDTKYQYCHVTPAAFIRDLGNEAKRVIFEALLNMRPMSAADMEIKLHLSRNAVARNIKAMRECGIVAAERKGLTYHYTLSKEYIGALTERLNELRYQR